MADWRSYDGIADHYARLWAPRFERAARHLLALAAPAPGGRLLDVGTGTGAVPAALGERVDDLVEVVGCDLSAPMLSRARNRVSRLQVAVATATRLPFPASSSSAPASGSTSATRARSCSLRESSLGAAMRDVGAIRERVFHDELEA